jgi:hypothetical protein
MRAISIALLSTTDKGTMVRQIRLVDLTVGMTLDEDLVSPKGIRLVPSGAEVTTTLMIRLTSIARGVGVAEPFRCESPSRIKARKFGVHRPPSLHRVPSVRQGPTHMYCCRSCDAAPRFPHA